MSAASARLDAHNIAPDGLDRLGSALAPGDPAPDLVLPAVAGRALARRAALAAAVLTAAAVAVIVAGGPLRTFADALGRALAADPRWVGAAAVFELLSFAGYIALLWLVGSRVTPRLDLAASAELTFGGAAATRLLPTGGVGGATLTIWAFRCAGLGARQATRTLLTFLVLLYAVFLGSIAVVGGALALRLVAGDGPLALSAVPAAGATLAIAGALALAAVGRRPAAGDRPVGAAFGASRSSRARAGVVGAPGAISAAVRDALALLRSGDARLLGALAWWAFDGAVLWAMLHALGAPPAVTVVVLAYFIGQIANTIPMPGAVSGGMVGVLVAFGVEAGVALASVLAYRSVAIWLPAPIGLLALGNLRRTVARWSAHDASDTEAPTSDTRSRVRDHEPRPAWPLPRAHRGGTGVKLPPTPTMHLEPAFARASSVANCQGQTEAYAS
jgi:uncharacterized membrane protein YbhN (UPF0104 family)